MEYSSSTLVFVSLLIIASAILQIILFFKVWGMTNNVKEIRDKYLVSDNLNFQIGRYILEGNSDKAREIILFRFYEEVKNLNYSDIGKPFCYDTEEELDNIFKSKKAILKKQLKDLGLEMPSNIDQMESGKYLCFLFNEGKAIANNKE